MVTKNIKNIPCFLFDKLCESTKFVISWKGARLGIPMDVVWLLEFPFTCFLDNCPQYKSLSNIVDTISTSIGRKCSSVYTPSLSHIKIIATNHFLFAYYLIQTPIIDSIVLWVILILSWYSGHTRIALYKNNNFKCYFAILFKGFFLRT